MTPAVKFSDPRIEEKKKWNSLPKKWLELIGDFCDHCADGGSGR